MLDFHRSDHNLAMDKMIYYYTFSLNLHVHAHVVGKGQGTMCYKGETCRTNKSAGGCDISTGGSKAVWLNSAEWTLIIKKVPCSIFIILLLWHCRMSSIVHVILGFFLYAKN